nr:uncharacterized protein CI109_005005 [Kwoniella shandongensis]KAA5526615.1 hypothetical protein CI109_005005 [Kwoniella shandongensis]
MSAYIQVESPRSRPRTGLPRPTAGSSNNQRNSQWNKPFSTDSTGSTPTAPTSSQRGPRNRRDGVKIHHHNPSSAAGSSYSASNRSQQASDQKTSRQNTSHNPRRSTDHDISQHQTPGWSLPDSAGNRREGSASSDDQDSENVKKWRDKYFKLKKRCDETQEECKRLRKDKDHLTSEITSLEGHHCQLRKHYEVLENDYDKLNEHYEQKCKNAEKYWDKLEKTNRLWDLTIKECDNWKARYTSLYTSLKSSRRKW